VGISRNEINDNIIQVNSVGKMYKLFDRPADRLKHSLFWRLGKQYGRDFWALRDVSFSVERGETIGVIGRNGSGKSTLLQLIAGILSPTEGAISVNGRVAALLELGSGFHPEYTGRENIFMSGAILGISYDEMLERCERIIAFADIGDFIDQPVKVYSSGMLARLAFSTAISVDADILIVDEILAVGDMAFQVKCLNVFHQLRDRGCTVLFVSHDPYTIRSFCQKGIYLKNGQMILYGPSYAVVDRYISDVEADQRKNYVEQVQNQNRSDYAEVLFRIDDVQLLGENCQITDTIRCGESVQIRFKYTTLTTQIEKIVFVFNLYQNDGFYICGTTTLMDGFPALSPGKGGWVTVTLPKLNLLAGNYYWRVAIDDDHGFGVYTAVTNVCPFKVYDHLEAVGLVNLQRSWDFEIQQ